MKTQLSKKNSKDRHISSSKFCVLTHFFWSSMFQKKTLSVRSFKTPGSFRYISRAHGPCHLLSHQVHPFILLIWMLEKLPTYLPHYDPLYHRKSFSILIFLTQILVLCMQILNGLLHLDSLSSFPTSSNSCWIFMLCVS